MRCDYDGLMDMLPPMLRRQAEQGRQGGRELRLRLGQPGELVEEGGSRFFSGTVSRDELQYIVSAVTGFSPWAAATLAQGYLTAPGGHRVGVCGRALLRGGQMEGLSNIESMCIRIARDYPGIGEAARGLSGSVLILGPPGWGKTTLLRDLIRQKGEEGPVCVVDERGELFPRGFPRGRRTDVLTGCSKGEGVMLLLRAMSPAFLAVDEITREEDSLGLLQAAGCGVRLLATAHAGSLSELKGRKAYRPLLDAGVFSWFLILHKDKSYHWERSGI